MAKRNSAEVTVKFRSPSFIHKGKKYLSKDVEAAANKGDEDAMRVIAALVERKSGVIIVEEEASPAAAKAPKTQKKPTAPKPAKGPKAKKQALAPAKGEESEEGPQPKIEKEDKNA